MLSEMLEENTQLDMDERISIALTKLSEAASSMEMLKKKVRHGS